MKYAQVENAACEFEEARKRYLRKNGWTYTSSNPGAFWLWEKKLDDGRTILCDLNFAVIIQRHLEGA